MNVKLCKLTGKLPKGVLLSDNLSFDKHLIATLTS